MPRHEENSRIGVAEAIAQLRAELSRARQQGEGQDIRFAAKEITVELSVDFGWSKEGGGGFKLFSFLDLSGKAGSTEKAVHKVTLKFEIARDGAPADQLISSPVNPHAPLGRGD